MVENPLPPHGNIVTYAANLVSRRRQLQEQERNRGPVRVRSQHVDTAQAQAGHAPPCYGCDPELAKEPGRVS
jgi:hypothetical protein